MSEEPYQAAAYAALEAIDEVWALADDLAADLELFNPKAPALARYREARGR